MKLRDPFIKITIEDEYGTSTVTTTDPEDETSDSYVEVAVRALLGIGFHHESIKRSMVGYLEEQGYFDEDREGVDADI